MRRRSSPPVKAMRQPGADSRVPDYASDRIRAPPAAHGLSSGGQTGLLISAARNTAFRLIFMSGIQVLQKIPGIIKNRTCPLHKTVI